MTPALCLLVGALYGGLLVHLVHGRRVAPLTAKLIELLDGLEADAARLRARVREWDTADDRTEAPW